MIPCRVLVPFSGFFLSLFIFGVGGSDMNGYASKKTGIASCSSENPLSFHPALKIVKVINRFVYLRKGIFQNTIPL